MCNMYPDPLRYYMLLRAYCCYYSCGCGGVVVVVAVVVAAVITGVGGTGTGTGSDSTQTTSQDTLSHPNVEALPCVHFLRAYCGRNVYTKSLLLMELARLEENEPAAR